MPPTSPKASPDQQDRQDRPERQEHRIGAHRVWFERPNLVYLVWDGPVNVDHIRRLGEIVAASGQSNLLVVNDLSRCDIPDRDARRLAAQDKHLQLIRAMAMVGASRPMRAMTNLIIRATTFFMGPQPTRTRFVEDEAEALAWLETQRDP